MSLHRVMLNLIRTRCTVSLIRYSPLEYKDVNNHYSDFEDSLHGRR